jgi:hypothetical protein
MLFSTDASRIISKINNKEAPVETRAVPYIMHMRKTSTAGPGNAAAGIYIKVIIMNVPVGVEVISCLLFTQNE